MTASRPCCCMLRLLRTPLTIHSASQLRNRIPFHRTQRQQQFSPRKFSTTSNTASNTAAAATSTDKINSLPFRAVVDITPLLTPNGLKAAIENQKHRNADPALPELCVALHHRLLTAQKQQNETLPSQLQALVRQIKSATNLDEKSKLAQQHQQLNSELKAAQSQVDSIQLQLDQALTALPNTTHPDVPLGGEHDYRVLQTFGLAHPPQHTFKPRNHLELCALHGLLPAQQSTATVGKRFHFLAYELALMEQALVQYALATCVRHGFTPVLAPDVIKQDYVSACGFAPRGDETQIYRLAGEHAQLSLAGTSEISMCALYSGQWMLGENLPVKHVCVSHAFRAEAGARGGLANKGLYRVHQFTKVEMFALVDQMPETSQSMLDSMFAVQREMYSALGLHCRLIDVASGDLGASAHRKWDVEAFMYARTLEQSSEPTLTPGLNAKQQKKKNKHKQKSSDAPTPPQADAESSTPAAASTSSSSSSSSWGELSSASICTDYQSRRLDMRYLANDGNKQLTPLSQSFLRTRAHNCNSQQQKRAQWMHSLNATAAAVPRLLVAILETHQREDGSIRIPEVLRPYMMSIDCIPHSMFASDRQRQESVALPLSVAPQYHAQRIQAQRDEQIKQNEVYKEWFARQEAKKQQLQQQQPQSQ